jgi:hypothetical protein
MRGRVMFVLAVVAIAGAVRAGPPYATDDPEPVELRHGEVYLATQGGLDRRGGVAFTAPHLEVNYGALPEVQLHAIAPLAYARPAGGPARYGLGDTELGAKVRFVRQGNVMPQIGTFPLIEVPTGDASRGLGAGTAQVFVPVWLQKSAGPWTAYGGGGIWVTPRDGRTWWATGWHAERVVGERLHLGAEVFRTTSSPDAPGVTRLAAGAVLDLGELHHLMGSIGRSAGGAPQTQWYVAYQLTFGPRGRRPRRCASTRPAAPGRPRGRRGRRTRP